MNAITKALASGTAVRTGVTVKALARDQQRWQAIDDTGETHGPFDILISTAPPVQSHALLAAHAPSLAATIAPVTMAPCWAVMLQLSERLPTSYDGAFVHNSPLSWIARNSSKPQRDAADCWVLHASADWSREHLEVAPDAALAALVDALGEATQQTPQVSFALAHRWRYALPVEPLHERCLFDRDLQIGACGDWCGGPRVEGAYLSGIAMADACLAEPN
jgi:predicted NAD/FAD-dependent oxidoreductase